MTDAELYAYGFYSLIAFGAALALLTGLVVMLRLEGTVGRWLGWVVVPVLGLGTAVSSALSGRNLKFASFNIEAITNPGAGGATNVLRILTLSLVGLCAATIVSYAFARRRGVGSVTPNPGAGLMLAFSIFYVSNAFLNAAFGTYPSFSHNVLYLPLVFGAVYLWRSVPLEQFVSATKWALLAFMVGSLVLALAVPSLAVQTAYKGWIPGVDIRLWGLASNPNSIGPLAALLMLLEWMQPTRHRLLRLAVWTSALLVLALAQSKTAWAALVLVLPLLTWQRWGRAPQGGIRIGYALVLLAVVTLGTVLLAATNLDRVVDQLASSQVGTDLSTLTGRAQIWEAAFRAWLANPVFGYGPSAWGPLHRASIGLPTAFSAHNQFLQSLSTAGLAGVISLVGYLVVLGTLAYRAFDVTQGVSLALFMFVFFRCFTETPYSPGTLFNGDVITHLVLFRLALTGAAQRHAQQAAFRPVNLSAQLPVADGR